MTVFRKDQIYAAIYSKLDAATCISSSNISCYAGEKFPDFHPTKVVSKDYAEIDDIGLIRDGDHLFFIQM